MTILARTLLAGLCLLAGCAAPAAPIHETTVTSAAGSRLFVRVIGNGADTVVVLHGGPGLHGGYLQEPLAALAAGRTFIVYDQRARGHSDTVPGSAPLRVQDDVDDLEALRTQLKLSQFSILAHHYGALVAVDYALAHPDRVRRLALIGPMVPRSLYRYDLAFQSIDTVAIERYRQALASDQPDRDPVAFCRENWGFFLGSERETDPEVLATIAPAMCDSSAFRKARIDTVNAQITTNLGAWDYRSRIGRLAVPVLVVTGDRNRALLHAARTWAYQAPQGKVLIFPTAGQFPWVGMGRQFTRVMDEFLSGQWPAAAERPRASDVTSPDDSVTGVPASDSSDSRRRADHAR